MHGKIGRLARKAKGNYHPGLPTAGRQDGEYPHRVVGARARSHLRKSLSGANRHDDNKIVFLL